MSDLSDLLELLYMAHRRFSTIRVTFRKWYDWEGLGRAYGRWAARQAPGSVSLLYAAHQARARQATPRPSFTQEVTRLWAHKPSRWRIEGDLAHGEGTPVKVLDGDRWWLYDPCRGVVETNADLPQPQGVASGMDMALQHALDPVQVIPTVWMEPGGQVLQAGRPAVLVRALPREGAHPLLWPGADSYELRVDAQYGILLRQAAGLEGQEYAYIEVTDVTFDQPLPGDTFVLQPPPGASVRTVQPPGPPKLWRRRVPGPVSRFLIRWGL